LKGGEPPRTGGFLKNKTVCHEERFKEKPQKEADPFRCEKSMDKVEFQGARKKKKRRKKRSGKRKY